MSKVEISFQGECSCSCSLGSDEHMHCFRWTGPPPQTACGTHTHETPSALSAALQFELSPAFYPLRQSYSMCQVFCARLMPGTSPPLPYTISCAIDGSSVLILEPSARGAFSAVAQCSEPARPACAVRASVCSIPVRHRPLPKKLFGSSERARLRHPKTKAVRPARRQRHHSSCMHDNISRP